MHPKVDENTSFITDQGFYCYKVMPFGLKNVGATYERLVNKMFAGLIGETTEVYVNDMLVKNVENKDLVSHLNETFQVLRRYRVRLSSLKYAFELS